MTERRRWLESRHLRHAPDGRHALATLDTLDPAVRNGILDRGDALASISVGLAHAWLTAAVAARTALSPADADRWEAAVADLLGDGGAGRASATAFLSVPPSRFAAAAPDARHAMVACARALQPRSQRLAAAFVETTGRALETRAADVSARALSAWSDAVARVLDASRWRGEILGTRLLASADELFFVLSPRAVAAWAAAFASVGQTGRSPRFLTPAAEIARLEPGVRDAVLAAVAAFASTDPAAGEKLSTALPFAAAALGADAAHALVDAVTEAGRHDGVAEAVALFGATAHEIPPACLDGVVRSARDIARRFAPGLAPYLRTVNRAFEEGGIDGVSLWVERGCEIGARNEHAGVAHFRLETRTAHKILVQHSAAVAFDEVEPVLRRFAVMIARRPLHLAAGGGVWLRAPLSAPEDRLIRLPERVDLFATAEDNQLFYKLAVAHAAARWDLGTYDLSVARLARDVELGNLAPGGDDVVALLDAFPNPLLAAGLFVVLEGARIDAALERELRGLSADLDRLGRLYASLALPAADRTPDTLVEALFALSVGRLRPEQLPPRLRSAGAIAARTLERLRRPAATVYDSARALVALYRSLALAAAVAARDDDLSTFVEIGGATVIDPLEHLDGGDLAPASGAPATARHPAASPLDTEGEIASQELRLELSHDDAPPTIGGIPLTPEQIRELLERGVDLQIAEGRGEDQASLGLYVTELLGKLPAATIERLRRMAEAGDATGVRAWLAAQRGRDFHWYDEWDYRIRDYRRRWCRLAELDVEGDGGRTVHRVLARSADVVGRVRREFLLMRPEQFRKVRGMQDGEDFDLAALVDAHADRRTRRSPSDRLYLARRREERDIATLFLVDMSASTDEPVSAPRPGEPARRVIDVIKDTLVVLSAVLAEIGDAYAVYGFSGHGRENVECYPVKTFAERWGPTVRGRIGGIEPKRSTRMGAALRHAERKLSAAAARARHLILLSDGFPQDYDYGEDRRSNVYGIRDTTVALQEIERRGISTFCITIDPAGHDYLREMCPEARYAVIEDVEALPEELPRIYRTVTR
jgi:nitric oxide reductase NorD protein